MTANLPIFFLYYYYHHLVISIPVIYVDCTVYCVCVQCTLQYQTNWNMVVFPYWLFVQTFIYPFPTKTYYGIYFQDVTKMLKTTSTANNSFGHWPASVCLCGKDRLAKWLIWWIDHISILADTFIMMSGRYEEQPNSEIIFIAKWPFFEQSFCPSGRKKVKITARTND